MNLVHIEDNNGFNSTNAKMDNSLREKEEYDPLNFGPAGPKDKKNI